MFDATFNNVALIRKNRPEWQAGLLNGIGGHIEEGEEGSAAIVREFREETSFESNPDSWKHFCTMSGTNNNGESFEILFYFDTCNLRAVRTTEDEIVDIYPITRITAGIEKTIGNLPWLVAMAVDFGKGVHPPKLVTADY